MLKRLAAVSLAVTLTASAQAQDPAAQPASPLDNRVVMTGEQVVRILDETADWYRMLGVQQQSATQPSDLLILYANRQSADRVVALAFELARANAELLSSQAELQQQADAASSPPALQRELSELDSRKDALEAEIATTRRELTGAAADERNMLQARVAELQSELDLVSARRNLVNNMSELAHETDANGSGVAALKERINVIEMSLPATSGLMPELGGAQEGAAAVANTRVADQLGARRFGIWDLAANVLRLQNKLSTIDDVDRRTEQLQQTFTQIRAMPEAQIAMLSARGDELGARPAGTNPAEIRAARGEYDTIAWLFDQTSSILVPLTKAGVLLEQYRNNLDSWRVATRAQFFSALKTLAARVLLLGVLLAAVFAGGEVWKRAVFNYVQETRRRHQLLLVRRIVVWAVALIIVAIAFATEASSFATFAGLLSAGVAVAMQSVLVSIVGYFFLIGKYGLRVGDHIQIGAVSGEVIDLGLVRLHLMELGPQYAPTGRVVALPNSVVFQVTGGIFKQIPGVSLAWRELSFTLPADADYAAIKERLLAAAARVLERYREELERQTRELHKTSSGGIGEQAQAQVQLRFSANSIEAIVRYPVPLQRAGEVEERMSRRLLEAVRGGTDGRAQLSTQPA
ncbi:MAG TPA: mechanosensitive ion channel domain-containing protein [Gammaproteobacteria bacterium]|nr:mechanosensitive ion channel domain-containing protein [Gammaproteobacteria bacterium]